MVKCRLGFTCAKEKQKLKSHTQSFLINVIIGRKSALRLCKPSLAVYYEYTVHLYVSCIFFFVVGHVCKIIFEQYVQGQSVLDLLFNFLAFRPMP